MTSYLKDKLIATHRTVHSDNNEGKIRERMANAMEILSGLFLYAIDVELTDNIGDSVNNLGTNPPTTAYFTNPDRANACVAELVGVGLIPQMPIKIHASAVLGLSIDEIHNIDCFLRLPDAICHKVMIFTKYCSIPTVTYVKTIPIVLSEAIRQYRLYNPRGKNRFLCEKHEWKEGSGFELISMEIFEKRYLDAPK